MDFQAGRFFSSTEKWLDLLNALRENGVDIAPWLADGVERGLNPYHKTLTIKNPTTIRFKSYFFKTFGDLKKRKFNNFNEFSGEILDAKLCELTKAEAIEEVPAHVVESDPDSVVSPIYLFECSNKKVRLIFHACLTGGFHVAENWKDISTWISIKDFSPLKLWI